MTACTIIAKNYVAYARVLAESYLAQHPDGRFVTLIIDGLEDRVDPAREPFDVLTPADLEIDDFERMAGLYDVLELSTAVKPWFLRRLLREVGDGGLLYLDPDMRVYRPLDDVFDLVREHSLVLCPHNLEPMPRDGRRPTEQDILIAGVYNLGFLGIGPGAPADRLLDWWSERLAADCIVDPERGLFVDQRWMDLVPGMVERYHVLRDPGFNVAYWNLASRPVSHRDGDWWVKGEVPLRLFHFSGFDPRSPHVLSKHQDRIRLSDEPDLAELCREYADELLAAGAREAGAWPYSYAETRSGVPLNIVVRRLYRELTLEGFDGSLFDSAGEPAFLDAVRQPAEVGGEHGVTRYLAALHAHRPDLRSAYPDLASARDAEGYLGWAHVFGRREIPIHDSLLPRRPAHVDERAEAAPRAPLGVNVAGYLRSELGVGEVARQAITALDAHEIPSVPVGLPTPRSREGHAFAHVAVPDEGFPINLVCVNADMLPQFAAEIGPSFFEDRHTIGWWWWEASVFPERWAGAFEHVDELWAGSRFVADALAAVSPVPVVRVPTPVSVPTVAPADRGALGLPDGFLFMFMFDFHSVTERKNPLGLVEAFLRAFPEPGAGASLVLKTINADDHLADHERLRLAIAGHPHVRLVDMYVSAPDRTRLLQSCDCYVSLHRSEGFGITMAEAMLLGKPVIATGYSGNLDFMTAENSFLVDFELAPIGAGADPYPADGSWADPDLDHAAALMRQVVEDPETAAQRARRGRDDVQRTHSPHAAGAEMARRLRLVHAAAEGRAGRARVAMDEASHAGHLLGVGPLPPGGRRLARLRGLPRRAVLRLMKPYTAYQAQIDHDLASGLHRLAAREEEDARRRLAVEAALLRELRGVDRRLAALEHGGDPLAGAQLDDLADQVDVLRARVDRHRAALGGVDLESGPDDPAGGGYPEAPPEPWSAEYNEAHARFVAHELDDAGLLAAFRNGGRLPEAFGRGYDERVVEFPWVLSHSLSGRLLDAGSTLNHLHILRRVRPRVDDLHIVTLAAEPQAFPRLDVSYLFADLRDLPLRDGTYDAAISISTFEHIGMRNTYYGSDSPSADDPQREALRAAREVARVVRPGGQLYVTVPVGRGERFPWVRSLTLDELDELVDAFGPATCEQAFFRHASGGWRSVGRDEVADARYRDHLASPPVGEDRVVAAEAVACVRLVTGT